MNYNLTISRSGNDVELTAIIIRRKQKNFLIPGKAGFCPEAYPDDTGLFLFSKLQSENQHGFLELSFPVSARKHIIFTDPGR